MNTMSRGIFGRFKRASATTPPVTAPEGEFDDQAVELAFDIHFCCICGKPLGFDFEDELDGEGPGRDICGPCNRTRNFDSVEMGW